MDPFAAVLFGAIALGLVAERLRSAGRPPGPRWVLAGRVVDGVALVLVVVLAVQFIAKGAVPRILDDLAPPPATGSVVAGTASAAVQRPDIYVFLLDGHLRADRMSGLFGVDGSAFTSALRDRGFDVSPGSRSNYIVTGQSVPTMLNMAHLPDLLRDRAIDMHAMGPGAAIRELINHAAGIEAFREAGYRVTSISPGFEEVALRKADRFIDTGQVNEFEYTLLRATGLGSVVSTLAPEFMPGQHRDRIRAVLQAAADVARSPAETPRLVWVHVPSPHAPAVFGPPGGPNPPPPDFDTFYDDTASGNHLDRATFGERYTDQAMAVDAQALQAIDAVLAASPQPPVIVVASDHGSGAGLTWSDLDGSDLDERTANLTAAYTPGHPNLFGDTPTLINTLPTLLRGYVGSGPGPIRDTLYVPLDDYGDVKEIEPSRIHRP